MMSNATINERGGKVTMFSKGLVQRLDRIEQMLRDIYLQGHAGGHEPDFRGKARENYGIAHGLCPNCGADMEAWEHDFGDAPCCKGAK